MLLCLWNWSLLFNSFWVQKSICKLLLESCNPWQWTLEHAGLIYIHWPILGYFGHMYRSALFCMSVNKLKKMVWSVEKKSKMQLRSFWPPQSHQRAVKSSFLATLASWFQEWPCQSSVHHFGPNWTTPTTVGWIF